MADRKPNRRPTLLSGLDLLEVLLESGDPLGVSELARAVDMDVGQTHRLLAGLAEAGYVDRDKQSSGYRLTAKIVQLAGRFLQSSDLLSVSRSHMQRLSAAAGETIHLAAVVGSALPVCIGRELSAHPVAVASSVGQPFPYETTAIGRAVLLAREETPSGRQAAYAVDREQHRPGVVGIASPILNLTADVVGAIAVSGPAFRLPEERIEELGTLVSSAGFAISRDLGYVPPTRESEVALT